MLDVFFLPAENADSKQLMIVLHGLGDSARGYAWLPPALNLPDMNYVLVNAPDPYFTGFSWYDYEGDQKPGVLRSRDSLFELIEALIQKGHPTEEMFLFGFSQGCLMTIDVGARFPGCFAGLIGISGKVFELENLINEAAPIAQDQRFLVTHGDSDPVIPIETTRPQIQALQGAGFQINWQEFAKQHGFAEPEELNAIRDFILSRQSKSPVE